MTGVWVVAAMGRPSASVPMRSGVWGVDEGAFADDGVGEAAVLQQLLSLAQLTDDLLGGYAAYVFPS